MLYFKRVFYILGLLLLMMPFQNCSMHSSAQSENASTNKTGDSGNGGGYEGKPDGNYYHFVPSYTCEGQAAANQIAEIKNGHGYLYISSDDQCSGQGTPITDADINVSPFQKEFISVKDLLFKRYDEKPVGIPNSIAEILCRDNFENPTVEIVSHYDREKNEAFSRVYFPGQQLADFSVSRILSSNKVRYVSNTISFNVDLSAPALPDRKFSGLIESSKLAGLANKALVCVLGGSLDTSKWALKTLTNIDVSGFQLLKNNEVMFFSEISRTYFSPTFYTYVSHLFKIGLDNVVSDFSKMILGESYNVISRVGDVDDNLSVFNAQLPSEGWPSMFVYDSRSKKTKKLTNLKAGNPPESYIMLAPVLTAGQILFYDTQIINGVDRTGVIRVYNLNDDSITDIAALDDSRGTKGYGVLPKSNKLLLFYSVKDNVKNIIQIYDAKSKTSKDLRLQTSGDCVVSGYNLQAFSDENSIVTLQTCSGSATDVIQINLTDGQVKTLATNSFISWMSEDKNRIIMTSSDKKNVTYDFRTNVKTDVPVDPRFGSEGAGSNTTDFILSDLRLKVALVNDRWMYGFSGVASSPTMYQSDLLTGTATPICTEALGKKLFVGQLSNQKVFLLTYDASVKVYRFYQVKGVADCARINEFPSDYPNVPKMIPTSIGFGLLLGNPISASTPNWTREAVFVPIDGRPPLKFNPNANGNWQMEVSSDKNRVVLSGPGLDGLKKIFFFDL